MTGSIIITLSVLLLLAYVFDITSSKTRIPSVILLLALGWGVRQISQVFDIYVPNLNPILPIIGTIGLILIVLEGSLELEFNPSNYSLVKRSTFVALLPIILVSIGIAWAFEIYSGISFKIGLVNAIPLVVISSAIAIPSVKNLPSAEKSFITYESSMSDIFGVILFNFFTINHEISIHTVGIFLLELVIMLIVAFGASVGLAFLLSKIKHKIKFVPIILLVLLIYSLAKMYHLPALVFILLFGLFLGNIDEIKDNTLIKLMRPDILKIEIARFRELNIELVFLIRSLFFLLFGFLIQTSELLNQETVIWACGIVGFIFALRMLVLRLFSIKLFPLVFIAPRGLITILLFLSIPLGQNIPIVNNSLIIQVIVLSAIIMMIGFIFTNTKEQDNV